MNEKKYVDVYNLLQHLPDEPYKGAIRRVLLQAPAADVVEVVRCCDCNNRNDEEKCPLCHVEYKTMFDYKTDDNGFCHKWERRNEDE